MNDVHNGEDDWTLAVIDVTGMWCIKDIDFGDEMERITLGPMLWAINTCFFVYRIGDRFLAYFRLSLG